MTHGRSPYNATHRPSVLGVWSWLLDNISARKKVLTYKAGEIIFERTQKRFTSLRHDAIVSWVCAFYD